MIVGVASGKGGTGKTTVSTNLAWCAPEPVLLLDCDVEEPNCHLFFPAAPVSHLQTIYLPAPVLDSTKCTACGKCVEICQFHAVAMLGKSPMFFSQLCHSCGGCLLVCPNGAITEVGIEIGIIEAARLEHCSLIHGRLQVGKALSPPLIRAVKRYIVEDRFTVIDSPPGTACPLAASLAGCDYVLLVAEPSKFGLHDLGLVVDTVRQLQIPFSVVINRANKHTEIIRSYCRRQGIEILLEIPESRQIAAAYARGRLAVQEFPDLRRSFVNLWSSIRCQKSLRQRPKPYAQSR